MNTATCHPDRPHYSKGMCKRCYAMHRHRIRTNWAAQERHVGDPPLCHPDRPYEARGLCGACYQRYRNRKDPARNNAQNKRWRQNNKTKFRESIRRWNLKKKFGITPEEYEVLLALQNHVCALCFRPERTLAKRLAVDHCHATGKVRGLLCGPCNVTLGYFENPQWSERARAYLAAHAEEEGAA